MAKSKWPQVLEKIENGLVEAWARDGLIDEQIAKRLGISTDTFYKYKKEYTVFSEALKRGKEVVDYEVENALLKRALGYVYDEITQEQDDGGALEVTKVVSKHQAPDVTAQIFWLKNRKPDKFRDRPQAEVMEMEDDGFLDALDGKLEGVWDD